MNKETKDRVIVEKAELDGKIVALTMFINGLKFPDIEEEQQVLLLAQLASMNKYSSILRDRLHHHESQKVRDCGVSVGQTEMSLNSKEPDNGALSPDKGMIYHRNLKGWVSVDSLVGIALYNKIYP